MIDALKALYNQTNWSKYYLRAAGSVVLGKIASLVIDPAAYIPFVIYGAYSYCRASFHMDEPKEKLDEIIRKHNVR